MCAPHFPIIFVFSVSRHTTRSEFLGHLISDRRLNNTKQAQRRRLVQKRGCFDASCGFSAAPYRLDLTAEFISSGLVYACNTQTEQSESVRLSQILYCRCGHTRNPGSAGADGIMLGLCDCMWVSFDSREPSICGLATVVGGRGAMVGGASKSCKTCTTVAALIIYSSIQDLYRPASSVGLCLPGLHPL